MSDNLSPMDINSILEILPHRFPFLLIDRILERREGFVVGQKCVTEVKAVGAKPAQK